MPFMRGLRITGGNRLSGTIAAHGAKNAVLPILAATVLCSRSEIKNCPNLSDVAVSCHILRHLGFAVERARDTLIITREDTGCRDVPSEWMRARCGSVTLCPPGGCALGGRPIDLHLSALRQMGAVISEEGDTLRCAAPGGLHGAAVQLPYPSVGATENLLIAAAGTPAETKITGAAAEPEISDLLAYLRGCGALIESQPDGAILVQGREALTGCCCHAILPDRIETATYLCACAACGGTLTLRRTAPRLAEPILNSLTESGCRFSCTHDTIQISRDGPLIACRPVVSKPYPGFPTDAMPVLLASQLRAEGQTDFTETIFENRFGYARELKKLGAQLRQDENTVHLRGAPQLYAAQLFAEDLRGGAALVLAAMQAEGESTIFGVKHIQRGYDNLEAALQSAGARLKTVEIPIKV